MVTKTDEDIKQLLDENEKVMVMFGASWCMPCKGFKPKFQKLSLENPDIVFAYCDADNTSNMLNESKIQSVPTTVAYVRGKKLEDMVGDNIDRAKLMLQKLRNTH